MRGGVARAPVAQAGYQGVAARAGDPESGHHAHREGTGAVGGGQHPEVTFVGESREHRRDAEPGGQAVGAREPRRVLGVGDRGQYDTDQIGGRLAKRPARLSARVPLDPAIPRVGRLTGDARERERARVGPGGVAVRGPQQGRPVGHQPVEQRLRGISVGEERKLPAPAPYPGSRGVRGRPRADAGRHRGDGLRVVEIALAEGDPTVDRVDVPILEAGQQHPAGQVDHLGAAPD